MCPSDYYARDEACGMKKIVIPASNLHWNLPKYDSSIFLLMQYQKWASTHCVEAKMNVQTAMLCAGMEPVNAR